MVISRIDMMQGADNAGLEAKIKQYYTESSQDEDSGVKGFVSPIRKTQESLLSKLQ